MSNRQSLNSKARQLLKAWPIVCLLLAACSGLLAACSGHVAGVDGGSDAGLSGGDDAGLDGGEDAGTNGEHDAGNDDAGNDGGYDANDGGYDANDGGYDAGLDGGYAGVDGGFVSEMLAFDWNKPATKADRGFPSDLPPIANGDWTSPVNYAQGTFHYRIQIRSQPVPQDMRLQFCVWQELNGNNVGLENCEFTKTVSGSPGTVLTWSSNVADMWKKNGRSIEWWRPRYRNSVAIKNSASLPVSDYVGWNWNGENPDEWYPLDMRYTVVVVAKDAVFSGWTNYVGN